MSNEEIIIRLLVALIIGGIVGIEREKSHQFAGFRTHTLVSVGSCLTAIASLLLFSDYSGIVNADPARLTAQVLSGIGFLGAGTIIKNSCGVKGLTTAATIWTTACIGIAIGYGYYVLGISAWSFIIIAVYSSKFLDKFFFKRKHNILTVKADNIKVISAVYKKIESLQITINDMDILNEEGVYIIRFYIEHDRRFMAEKAVVDITKMKHIISVEYLH